MQWKPYTQYKPSGVEWLGNIPAHWQAKRLKYCAPLVNEKTDGQDSDLPYTGLEHIESWTGRRIQADDGLETEGQASKFLAGDILFGKLRPYLAKVYRATEDGVCTGELLVLRPQHASSGFLSYYLLAREFICLVDSSTYGAKMPRASWDFIGNLPTLLPSDREQRAVALFLDRETARIDGLIEKKRRQIELLQEKRAALITHAVTKGLNPNAPMKDSGVEWLGKVPAHWNVLAFRRIAKRVDVGIAEAATHAYSDSGVPIIRSTNVRPNRIDAGDLLHVEEWFAEKNRSKYLYANDLVTVRTGAPGTTAVVPQSLNRCQCFTMLITTLRASENPHFYSYFLNSTSAMYRFSVEGWGTAQINISVPILQEQVAVRPPKSEQDAIVKRLDRELRRADSLAKLVQESVAALREYRAALISSAVTGKIDVQDSGRSNRVTDNERPVGRPR